MSAELEKMVRRILEENKRLAAELKAVKQQKSTEEQSDDFDEFNPEETKENTILTASDLLKRKFSFWEAAVKAAQRCGLDFDKTDIASLHHDYRKIHKLNPRFLDRTKTDHFSSDYASYIQNKLPDTAKKYAPALINMYMNRFICQVTGFGSGVFFVKIVEDIELASGEVVDDVRYVHKNKSAFEMMFGRYTVPKVKYSEESGGFSVSKVKASTVYQGLEYQLTFSNIGMNCSNTVFMPRLLNLYMPPPYFQQLSNMTEEKVSELARQAAPWYDLLLNQLANGCEASAEYICNWFAHLVQKPGVKMGVALGFTGPQGIGKNTLVKPIQDIFGDHAFETNNAARDVFGQHNTKLQRALFVMCNEALWGGDKSLVGPMKGLITDDTITINPKGKDQYTQKNCLNIMFASNNSRIVPAEEKERRYALFETSDRYSGTETKESEAYFAKVRAVPTLAVLAFLMRRDISDWKPRTIVKTEALRHQQKEGMSGVTAFWNNAMTRDDGLLGTVTLDRNTMEKYGFDCGEEMLTGDDDFGFHSKKGGEKKDVKRGRRFDEFECQIPWSDEKEITDVPKGLVYLMFDQWRTKMRERYKTKYNEVAFWKETRKCLPEFKEPRPKTNGIKGPVHIRLPTLDEARRHFAEVFMKDEHFFEREE